MRRDSGDDVAAVARRRLELLGRELALAGQAPGSVTPWEGDAEDDLIAGPAVVPDPGRHARRRGTPGAVRTAGWLQDRLPAGLQGRVALRPGHVALLGILVAAAVAGTAWWTLRAAPEPIGVPVAQVSPGPAPSPAPSTGSRPGAAAGTRAPNAPGGAVVVDVAGKVRRPGVATLPAGSRVVDALKRAGGAREGVDLSTLNLARVLVDGEQILVGVPPVGGAAATTAPAPGSGPLVNLNTSTLDQLDALPGVGPVTAQKILDWRTEHGAFTALDELLEVDGIGAKTFEEIAPHVTL